MTNDNFIYMTEMPLPPGECAACMAYDVPVIDIKRDIRPYGIIYICEQCARDILEHFPETEQSEQADYKKLYREEQKRADKLEETINVAYNILSEFANSGPDSGYADKPVLSKESSKDSELDISQLVGND